MVLFVLAEAAIFRSGWYVQYLEPDSSAGMVESHLHWLTLHDPARVPELLVVGDSRIAEGFSAPLADQAAGNRVHFWNFGMGGTTPRIWYYVLRDGDPTRRRFAAIVIALDEYPDEDRWDNAPDRLIDLNFVIGRLRLSDCWLFATSMLSPEFKAQAFTGCLLKGLTLRRDVQSLAQNRADRIKRSAEWRKNGIVYVNDYGGHPDTENLRGLTADYGRQTIQYPPNVPESMKDTLRQWLMPPPSPQTGAMTRYRNLWLNKILDLYKDSPTKIVFLELARTPVPKPESRNPATWLNTASKRPRVVVLPQSTFRDLERPELFWDMLHFNRAGRALFTERIARQVPPLVGVK